MHVPGFHGTIGACIRRGSQALLRVQEDLGTRLFSGSALCNFHRLKIHVLCTLPKHPIRRGVGIVVEDKLFTLDIAIRHITHVHVHTYKHLVKPSTCT